MTNTAVLYRLQGIDSKADAGQSRIAEIDELLEQNQDVRRARDALSEAEEQEQKTRSHITSQELDIASLDDKISNTEQRLYSGTVTNPKELQDMEQELALLRTRHQLLDDEMLEAMLALEENQSKVAQARATLETVESVRAESQSDLLDEKATINARLLELEDARTSVIEQVPAEMLRVYQELRSKLSGLAVAKMQDGVCSACGVAPNSRVVQQARHRDFDARCPTCGRILSGN